MAITIFVVKKIGLATHTVKKNASQTLLNLMSQPVHEYGLATTYITTIPLTTKPCTCLYLYYLVVLVKDSTHGDIKSRERCLSLITLMILCDVTTLNYMVYSSNINLHVC